MVFQVGDKVIHKRYGLGEVVDLDEKEFAGQRRRCYVVRIRDLTMWVPEDENSQSSLRSPTPQIEFEKLFSILRSDGEPLSNDRFMRKSQLSENMQSGDLEGVCRVIRDLKLLGSMKKLNMDDRTILERAESFLINEWVLSFSITQAQAQREMNSLLGV